MFNTSCFFLSLIVITVFLFIPVSQASNTSQSQVLELERPVLLNEQQGNKTNTWLSYRTFDQNFDFLNYAGKKVGSTKLERWTSLRGGVNANLNDDIRLRLYFESGSQHISRAIEPKQLNPKYWGADLRLQWNTHINLSTQWAVEIGYRMHESPTSSVRQLRQGSILATAAPGKSLFDSSSKDKGWLISTIASHHLTDHITLHSNLEYRSIQVQASTTSQDPLVQDLLDKRQAPQTTPWQEQHIIVGFGLDWFIFDKIQMSMDFRQYTIHRENYLPRTGFPDYNKSEQFDVYLSYTLSPRWLVIAHGQATSHFVLGDLPALYNRRNNHGFKKPIGFIAIGLQYTY